MQPNDYNILFDALSVPRIGVYKYYFGLSLSNKQLYGCYQWNESVSHAFFKQRPWQYDLYHTLGNVNSCNWFHAWDDNTGKGVLTRKSLAKIHNRTHNQRNGSCWRGNREPSPDDVVSGLSFGFWSSLVDKCPSIDWDIILKDVFPSHRASNSNQWNSAIEKKKLSYRLDLVRDFRNRIAHHEPIWKFKNLYSERPSMRNGQINRNEFMPISMNTTRFKRELSSILRGKKITYLHRGGRNLIATHPIL